MTEDQIARKIAVIFVTDVVSFSTLMEKNENSTLISLRACRQIMNQLLVNMMLVFSILPEIQCLLNSKVQ